MFVQTRELPVMIQPRKDNAVQLSDKQRLAYAEYGEPNGPAVFLFHCLPGAMWGGLLCAASIDPKVFAHLGK